jgi:chromosome segregation ATPase
MSEKQNDAGLIPAIKPDKEDVDSFRRSGRPEAPRQSNFNGLLVFVILVMAIMMGVGGFALWEVQQKLAQSNQLLAKGQENVRELEDRLSATGTDVSKTLQTMQAEIKTNFSEIDKLWGVSYRNNRPNIDRNMQSIDQIKTTNRQLDGQLAALLDTMNEVTTRFDRLGSDMIEVRQGLIDDNTEMVTQVSMIRGQIQDQTDQVEANKRAINIIDKQMIDANEAIDVINRYRIQINQRLVEMERNLQAPSAPASLDPS